MPHAVNIRVPVSHKAARFRQCCPDELLEDLSTKPTSTKNGHVGRIFVTRLQHSDSCKPSLSPSFLGKKPADIQRKLLANATMVLAHHLGQMRDVQVGVTGMMMEVYRNWMQYKEHNKAWGGITALTSGSQREQARSAQSSSSTPEKGSGAQAA